MEINKSPVFIIGSHRSGSTLLRYLIDTHPRIACPPETKLVGAIDAFFRYPQTLIALETLGFTREDVLRRLRSFLEAILTEYSGKQGKQRWVEKTPNNFRYLAMIDEIFDRTAIYIVIVRHPLDCITSLVEFFLTMSQHYDPDISRHFRIYGESNIALAQYWKTVYETIHTFAAGIQERVWLVQYEQLTASPSVTLQELLGFLNEEYCPELLNRALIAPHTSGYEDSKILSTRRIHTDSVGRWRELPDSQAHMLWRLVSDTAEKYGYVDLDRMVDPHECECSPFSPFRQV